ncbi:MAG: VWA domain-containing protein [Blastochloris sp.]|nr:VWA domain-containing protein [Blastochloris sp.]
MAFLNPLILFGLLGIGIPILIHLLNKTRVKRIRWAAMKYLMNAVQKNQRRLKVEDLILLLLRCLLVILLVLAFARLVTPKPSEGFSSGDGPVAAVIVLDQSASMSQSDGATTRMLEGKDAAKGILESFRPGSSCALLLVSDTVNALVPQPSQDFALLKKWWIWPSPRNGAVIFSRPFNPRLKHLSRLRGNPARFMSSPTVRNRPGVSWIKSKACGNRPGVKFFSVLFC